MTILSQSRISSGKRGFTLIELLVVIAIIGILSSVVLSALNQARVKSRDARRESDLHQIQVALQLYYNDNGRYPYVGAAAFSCTSNWDLVRTALAPYMSEVPVDPVNTPCNGPYYAGYYTYSYQGSSDGSVYDLLAQYENRSNPNRCEIRGWPRHVATGGASWCAGNPPANYLFSDHW